MDFNLPVTPTILKQVARIDQFRGTWASGALLPSDRLARMRDAAHAQSVAAACRMAGIRVADAEVVSILDGQTSAVREAPEVLGYSQALKARFAFAPIVTTGEIRRLHGIMLSGAVAQPAPTPWRESAKHLEAFDSKGHAIGRVFQTLPPRLIPETTENLVTWLELGLKGHEQHPLMVVGAFVLALFHASPFDRGNVRISCLLTFHLLQRAGYDFLPYASLEREFEDRRVEFYDAFDASSTKLWTGEANLTPWLAYFLESLVLLSDRVATKMDLERRVLEFSPLQRTIVETVREHGSAAAALLLTATGTNRNTLKDNLRRLVERGVLEQMGRRRGTIYRLATGEPARNSIDEPIA
jgi:Fic family protein